MRLGRKEDKEGKEGQEEKEENEKGQLSRGAERGEWGSRRDDRRSGSFPQCEGGGVYNDSMSLRKVGHFPSRLEAEAIGYALEQHSIPFVVRSEDLGIFGPGHSWATPQGATLWVPEECVERVRELMSCLVPLEGEENGEGLEDQEG